MTDAWGSATANEGRLEPTGTPTSAPNEIIEIDAHVSQPQLHPSQRVLDALDPDEAEASIPSTAPTHSYEKFSAETLATVSDALAAADAHIESAHVEILRRQLAASDTPTVLRLTASDLTAIAISLVPIKQHASEQNDTAVETAIYIFAKTIKESRVKPLSQTYTAEKSHMLYLHMEAVDGEYIDPFKALVGQQFVEFVDPDTRERIAADNREYTLSEMTPSIDISETNPALTAGYRLSH